MPSTNSKTSNTLTFKSYYLSIHTCHTLYKAPDEECKGGLFGRLE